MKRMYVVFYNGNRIGLTKSDPQNIAADAKRLAINCTQHITGSLYGSVIDENLITVDDSNQARFRHLL